MNRYPWWKYGIIGIVSMLGILYALPNFFGEDPVVQVSAHQPNAFSEPVLHQLKQRLQDQRLAIKYIKIESSTQLLIAFNSIEDQLAAHDILMQTLGEHYTVALNLVPSTPPWLQAIGAKPMKLGLDLRGGVHFLLAIDIESLLEKRLQGDVRNIRDELRVAKIRGATVSSADHHRIMIQFRTHQDLKQGLKLLKPRFVDYHVEPNAMMEHRYLSLVLTPAAITRMQVDAVEQTITILRHRVNELGVAEPIVQQQGIDRIAVDLPGIQDTARAKQILGGTASIELRLVDTDDDPVMHRTHHVPASAQLYTYRGSTILLEKRVVLAGASITGAVASVDDYGQPSVQVRLGGGGESHFYRVTKQNIGRPMAIVFIETKLIPQTHADQLTFVAEKQEKIISVATIKSALANNFQITGLTDSQEAADLALFLRSGALPAPISVIEESTIGPSLGKDNIIKGVQSVAIGFGFIVAFMLIYYRFFGLAADLALFMNLIFLMAIMSMIGATLTLPGIAGILLTLGMSVDANVLIFERIREELRGGMSCQASIYAGFDRAFSTIVDANITTLIAALALFALGSGAVKGFAVTLTIGLLTSMFTAIMGTRAIINLVYGNKRQLQKLSIGI